MFFIQECQQVLPVNGGLAVTVQQLSYSYIARFIVLGCEG